MQLSELNAHLKKYHTSARQLPKLDIWVVDSPYTGMWVAVLKLNADSGAEIEYFDIKTEDDFRADLTKPYLTQPFRMRCRHWIGVKLGKDTPNEAVFRLLDKAIISDEPLGCKIVLGRSLLEQQGKYHDTLLPLGKPAHCNDCKNNEPVGAWGQNRPSSADISFALRDRKDHFDLDSRTKVEDSKISLLALDREKLIRSSKILDRFTYVDTALPAPNPVQSRLREMRKLYQYGDGSFLQKCKNFYLQGKFMEDFEPESAKCLVNENIRIFFPTYSDLNHEQLIWYFFWRKNIRHGQYEKISISLAYIYIYELLNGIGTSSVTDSLEKLKIFEEKFILKEYGDSNMLHNIHRWMFELAVMNSNKALSQKEVIAYAPPEMIKRDSCLTILRHPEKYEDQEVFQALIETGERPLNTSPAFDKNLTDGVHLYAEAWRIAVQCKNAMNKGLFDECFGDDCIYPWHPLANAIYYQQEKMSPFVCVLNDCHKFSFNGTQWNEQGYQELHFNKGRLNAFMHETDRNLRLYLKIGRPLKVKPREAWASSYIEEAIERDKAQKAEAARTKVKICFSDLEKIRIDAIETRDSLLTDEEICDENVVLPKNRAALRPVNTADPAIHFQNDKSLSVEMISNAPEKMENVEEFVKFKSNSPVQVSIVPNAASSFHVNEMTTSFDAESESEVSNDKTSCISLDGFEIQILIELLHGHSVKAMIAERHGMPEIVADAINEALYDKIGDSVVICEGDSLRLIEDYRDELAEILGERT